MKTVPAIILLLVLATTLPAAAAEREARTLGDHQFLPNAEVRDPFITAHFRNLTGVSIASGVDLPLLVVPTEPPDTLLKLDGDFVFIAVEMEYQYAFNDRAALRGQFFGLSRVGTSGTSILSQGVTASWGLEFGSTVALWRNDNTLLSAIADIRQAKVLVIDLLGYVSDIVDGNTAAPSLVQSEDRTSLLGGLSVARTINRWSGLVASLEAGYGHGNVSKGNAVWSGALSGSVDFGQRDQAPVGLLATVAVSQVPNLTSFSGDIATTVGLTVLYTGRDDFNVGGAINWSRIPLQFDNVDVNPISFSGVLRYFF